MQEPVVLIGVGEMGGVFARGLLRRGHPVYPITRLMDLGRSAGELPNPALVLVAVAEDDLQPVLETLPEAWRDRTGLLQNELLPRDWQQHDLSSVTVISVWFEKKKGRDVRVLLPSPAYGPAADLLVGALGSLDIPARRLDGEAELEYELVRKNVYILTTNIAGLVVGGTTAELWHEHRQLAQTVADEVMDIQAWLTGRELPRTRLLEGMEEALLADPEHQCTGRSAPARLARALTHADAAGLEVPRLREIRRQLKE